jgi:hypothetical protein
MRKRKIKPKKVSFEENDEDFMVAVLACMGYSTICISNATGYTEPQVNYRIGVAGLQWARHNFRNGTSEQAQRNLSQFLDMDTESAEKVVNIFAADLDVAEEKGKKIKPKRRVK